MSRVGRAFPRAQSGAAGPTAPEDFFELSAAQKVAQDLFRAAVQECTAGLAESRTLTFEPGPVGMDYDYMTGQIMSVNASGQGYSLGVRDGWQFALVAGRQWEDGLWQIYQDGKEDYTLTFYVPVSPSAPAADTATNAAVESTTEATLQHRPCRGATESDSAKAVTFDAATTNVIERRRPRGLSSAVKPLVNISELDALLTSRRAASGLPGEVLPEYIGPEKPVVAPVASSTPNVYDALPSFTPAVSKAGAAELQDLLTRRRALADKNAASAPTTTRPPSSPPQFVREIGSSADKATKLEGEIADMHDAALRTLAEKSTQLDPVPVNRLSQENMCESEQRAEVEESIAIEVVGPKTEKSGRGMHSMEADEAAVVGVDLAVDSRFRWMWGDVGVNVIPLSKKLAKRNPLRWSRLQNRQETIAHLQSFCTTGRSSKATKARGRHVRMEICEQKHECEVVEFASAVEALAYLDGKRRFLPLDVDCDMQVPAAKFPRHWAIA
jgi:hypothetical protein